MHWLFLQQKRERNTEGIFMEERNTLLIVDDFEFNRLMLSDTFSDRRVIEAENGKRAIEEFEKNNLFGVAGTLWSECINSPERIYYQAYPRSLALAEAGWSFQKNRSWEGFLTRLKPTVKDMMRRGITFSMEY